MLLSRQLSLPSVIALCRALRHSLDAGIGLLQVFRQQAERGVPGVRPLAGRVLNVLEQGHSLSDALENERGALPPLLLSLVKVGEEFCFLREAVDRAWQLLQEFLLSHGTVTVAEARDLLGTSRRYCVPLLEFFDQARKTRRLGDKRALFQAR